MQGYIRLYRKIIGSEIYKLSPLYLRVFERLILEANHKDNSIPYKDRVTGSVTQKLIKRGERLTSLRQIAEWVSWYEWNKQKIPNTKTISKILNWLEKNKMINFVSVCRESNRKETHYSIVNYESYQGNEIEKVTGKVTGSGYKQECKECKRKKINKSLISFPMDTKVKEKSYRYSLANLFKSITGSNEISYCYSVTGEILKKKELDNLNFLQKCLMLMFIIKANQNKINEPKYKGILINQYRGLCYSDFKRNVFNTSANNEINNVPQMEAFN